MSRSNAKELATVALLLAAVSLASWGWRAHVARQDGQALARLARPGDIRMISSETCGYCVAARRWMTAEGVPFSECLIERDAQCLADFEAAGGLGTPTLIVRGQRVIGFDRAGILAAMK